MRARRVLQKTLSAACEFRGVGFHSGTPVSCIVQPASVNSGINFLINKNGEQTKIPALFRNVSGVSLLRTKLGMGKASVMTVEHLLSALYGFGVTNALIKVDGGEVPALDGSALQFSRSFAKVGTVEQDEPAVEYILKDAVEVDGPHGSYARAVPLCDDDEQGLHLEVKNGSDGKQELGMTLTDDMESARDYLNLVAPARTYCFDSEFEGMHRSKLRLGGSMDNLVVFDSQSLAVKNPGGLRFADEPARHRMLDMIGDLSLCGGRLRAKVTTHLGGHELSKKLLAAMMEVAVRADEYENGAKRSVYM